METTIYGCGFPYIVSSDLTVEIAKRARRYVGGQKVPDWAVTAASDTAKAVNIWVEKARTYCDCSEFNVDEWISRFSACKNLPEFMGQMAAFTDLCGRLESGLDAAQMNAIQTEFVTNVFGKTGVAAASLQAAGNDSSGWAARMFLQWMFFVGGVPMAGAGEQPIAGVMDASLRKEIVKRAMKTVKEPSYSSCNAVALSSQKMSEWRPLVVAGNKRMKPLLACKMFTNKNAVSDWIQVPTINDASQGLSYVGSQHDIGEGGLFIFRRPVSASTPAADATLELTITESVIDRDLLEAVGLVEVCVTPLQAQSQGGGTSVLLTIGEITLHKAGADGTACKFDTVDMGLNTLQGAQRACFTWPIDGKTDTRLRIEMSDPGGFNNTHVGDPLGAGIVLAIRLRAASRIIDNYRIPVFYPAEGEFRYVKGQTLQQILADGGRAFGDGDLSIDGSLQLKGVTSPEVAGLVKVVDDYAKTSSMPTIISKYQTLNEDIDSIYKMLSPGWVTKNVNWTEIIDVQSYLSNLVRDVSCALIAIMGNPNLWAVVKTRYLQGAMTLPL